MSFTSKLEAISSETILCTRFMSITDFLTSENTFLVIFIEKKAVIWNTTVFPNLVYSF